jgi:hypothetical protein
MDVIFPLVNSVLRISEILAFLWQPRNPKARASDAKDTKTGSDRPFCDPQVTQNRFIFQGSKSRHFGTRNPPMPFRRSIDDQLIERLKESLFWQHICQDSELRPEIRNGSVTVYYRGNALLQGLKLKRGRLVATIHRKYIPLNHEGEADVRIHTDDGGNLRYSPHPTPLELDCCDERTRDRFKCRLNELSKGTEEDIVHSLICKRGNVVIDQQIAFKEGGDPQADRIDLCVYNKRRKCLAFVEVKRKNDSRLFAPRHNQVAEVLEQLRRYVSRIEAQRTEILDAYRRVVQWKHDLGLQVGLDELPVECTVMSRPVLLIGGCSQPDVDAILRGDGYWAISREQLERVASALLVCGDRGRDLNFGPEVVQGIVFPG